MESAQGNSLYSGQVTIGSTRQDDGTYALIDPAHGGHRTLDSSVNSNGVLFTADNDVWGDGTVANPQTAAVDAAYGAQTTWDFYNDRFGRNGIADDGRGSSSRVHYESQQGVPLANANWQDGCFCMSYGDGADGQHPVTSLDIAAHEMTHGVTSSTAGLGDFGESPGLNEAISDMMAAASSSTPTTERRAGLHDGRAGQPARRRQAHPLHGPPLKGRHQLRRLRAAGLLDAAGEVARTSHGGRRGRPLFFYLLAEGSGQKTINGVNYDSPTYDKLPVAGIGRSGAADVVYRALTVYMTSTTDYAGARTATLQAAADLYGSQSMPTKPLPTPGRPSTSETVSSITSPWSRRRPSRWLSVSRSAASSAPPAPGRAADLLRRGAAQGPVDQPHHGPDHRYAQEGRGLQNGHPIRDAAGDTRKLAFPGPLSNPADTSSSTPAHI